MGIYFKHDLEHNFMLALFHGEVSDLDLHAHVSHMLESEFDQEGKIGLVVLCENMESVKLSFHAIFSAGKRMCGAKFRKNGKLAMITNSAVTFGLAKTYQMAAEVTGLDEIRVMHSHELDDAMGWLGVGDLSAEIKSKVQQCENGIAHEVDLPL